MKSFLLWLRMLGLNLDVILKQNKYYVRFFFYVARIVSIKGKGHTAKHHYLIPAPGNGNVGDQAMCDAFASKLQGRCTFVVENAQTFNVPRGYESEIQLLEIPKIIYGGFIKNAVAILKLARHKSQMQSVSLVGADVMDGVYNLRASINRLFLIQTMNYLNIPTRILGFSWSKNPKAKTLSMIKDVSNKTKLLVRDPRSAERLRASGVLELIECADIVFSDQSEKFSESTDLWVNSNKIKIVAVNISGLGNVINAQSKSQLEEYEKIIKHIKNLGYRVLMIPHVFRPIDGDLEISEELFRLACDETDYLIREIFEPAEERNFIRNADFLVTARMHTAIIALSAGVPTIAIETMGKVEGLFELFGNTSYCISGTDNFSGQVITCIDDLHRDYSLAVKLVESQLQKVKSLSSRNFEGL